MGKITRFTYKMLRREEQHSFNDRVMRIVESTCGACGKPYLEFKKSAERLDEFLASKSDQGVDLAELDNLADEAWNGLHYQIQASLRYPLETVRKAAVRVEEVFYDTPNPTRLSYDQEYGALKTLLTRLNGLGSDVLKISRVDVYVEYLRKCVDDFLAAQASSVDEKSKKISGEWKDIVEQCYRNWLVLKSYLEAMQAAEALPGVDETVSQIDTVVLQVRQRLTQRMRMNQSDATENTNIIDDREKSVVLADGTENRG